MPQTVKLILACLVCLGTVVGIVLLIRWLG
jgi:hypothetical protein